MAPPTVQPVRRRKVPWSRTVHSEVRGEVFGTGANRVLALDPSRRRTTVQRGGPSAPYLADLLTVPRAALRQACRLNDLRAELPRCGQVPRMPEVADLRCVISRHRRWLNMGPLGLSRTRPSGICPPYLLMSQAILGPALPRPRGAPCRAGRRRVGQSIELMHAVHAEPVGIIAICRRLNCSPRSLQLAFGECGIPAPRNCLAQARLYHVRADLLSGRTNVT